MSEKFARASLSRIFIAANQSLSYGCYVLRRLGREYESSRTSLSEVNRIRHEYKLVNSSYVNATFTKKKICKLILPYIVCNLIILT